MGVVTQLVGELLPDCNCRLQSHIVDYLNIATIDWMEVITIVITSDANAVKRKLNIMPPAFLFYV